MLCNSCGVLIPKEFKAALVRNVCPACSKPILASGNPAVFSPLCELIGNAFYLRDKSGEPVKDENKDLEFYDQEENVEELALMIITTFNVRSKSDKDTPEVIKEDDPDAEYKRKQMSDAKTKLAQMREEAYKDAMRGQWGMAPGEEKLDPDIGEELADQMNGEGMNAGQALINKKQQTAHNNLLNGSGLIRRGS